VSSPTSTNATAPFLPLHLSFPSLGMEMKGWLLVTLSDDHLTGDAFNTNEAKPSAPVPRLSSPHSAAVSMTSLPSSSRSASQKDGNQVFEHPTG
jgi:hypothetical protein